MTKFHALCMHQITERLVALLEGDLCWTGGQLSELWHRWQWAAVCLDWGLPHH